MTNAILQPPYDALFTASVCGGVLIFVALMLRDLTKDIDKK